ncbi:hypothetical protein MAR_037355 [Mya arenaria]|uniref:GPN-loop GTPase 3 n=1 Tax=Mya arenaria TaxID=6604 RepID=A0ABY7FS18_MYAAR|nr:hypothetical protein MAR_037355 [Mya arenaria]
MSAPGVDMSRGSTPHLPPIDAGYDTPGSDYMSAMRARQTLASGSDKGSFCHVKTSSARRGDDPFVNRKTTNCGCSREHDITNIKPQENGQDPNEKLMLSRKSIVRELTMPATNFAKHGVAGKSASDAGAYACTSPHKHNHPGSGSTKRRMSVRSIPKIRLTTAWNAPPITDVRYQEAKRRLMEGSGKFSGQMRRYFREEVPWWEQVPDSDDDDYDTDLDTHIENCFGDKGGKYCGMIIELTGNSFPARQTIDFLTGLLSSPGSLVYIGLQVTPVTEDVRGVVKALQTVHNIVVEFADPPAHRHVTRDVLTSNLIQVAMFMDREGLAVDDLFPDWEDEDEDCMLMITVDEVFTAIEPLRTHLRRSLKEEQEEKERQQRKKARKRRPVGGLTDTADA